MFSSHCPITGQLIDGPKEEAVAKPRPDFETTKETLELEPRNQQNRNMFGSRLSLDIVTGQFVHGKGCRLEYQVLRDYYTEFDFGCGSLGSCPACAEHPLEGDLRTLANGNIVDAVPAEWRRRREEHPIFCRHSPAARAYVQGRRTKEVDEFFVDGGESMLGSKGKRDAISSMKYVQWDLSQAPEACLSVTLAAQQQLRIEMAVRRDRWAAAHGLKVNKVYNDVTREWQTDSERFFDSMHLNPDDLLSASTGRCVQGQPIP